MKRLCHIPSCTFSNPLASRTTVSAISELSSDVQITQYFENQQSAKAQPLFPLEERQAHLCIADNQRVKYFNVQFYFAKIKNKHMYVENTHTNLYLLGVIYFTSALKTSRAKPLKQLMTACWMSRPSPSSALIVERRRPGRRAQNICMLTARPSRTLTST